MKKKSLVLASLLLTATALASCGKTEKPNGGLTVEGWNVVANANPKDDGTSSTGEVTLSPTTANSTCPTTFDTSKKYKVSYWSTMGDTLKSTITSHLKDGKTLPGYPNIEVELVTYSGYTELRNAIVTAIPTGGYPDLSFCYPDHVALYNNAEVVTHLDSFIQSPEFGIDSSNITGAFYGEGAAFGDGHMYALPFAKSTEVLYYDKDFFTANKLEVPTTWSEMWTLCEDILAIDENCIPLGIDSEANLFIELAKQYGFDYTNTSGEFLFDNEGTRSFVQSLANMYDEGYFTTQTLYGTYTSSLFSSKTDPRCYMCIGSTGGAQYQYSDSFETGIAMIPAADGGSSAVISQGPSLCMFDKSADQELASWLVTKFLLSDEVQIDYAKASGYIPVTQSAQNSATYQTYLDGRTQNTKPGVIAKAAYQSVQQLPYYFTSAAFNGSSTARDEVGNIIVNVISGTKSIDSAFKNAMDECEYAAS